MKTESKPCAVQTDESSYMVSEVSWYFLLNISKFSFMVSAFEVVFVGGYSKHPRLFK